ncbi:hypothetical protein Tco_1032260 [Tanacetum coccineum]|uniref:Uncharacterized protein n=1 Tax=Tanacetum coccineum TaxID=301880 RepID=A0ABQ5GC54_9ASTR
MILILKTSHHGPSDAMHNPSQLLRLLSKEVCFISHRDQHASIDFLIPRLYGSILNILPGRNELLEKIIWCVVDLGGVLEINPKVSDIWGLFETAKIMETEANEPDHLVNYDDDNDIDDLIYESEVYLEEEEDQYFNVDLTIQEKAVNESTNRGGMVTKKHDESGCCTRGAVCEVSPVDINPIDNNADEEGGTPLSVIGCENDASIHKSNRLATSEKEIETRATPPSTIQMIGENKTAPKLQSKRKNIYVSHDTMQKHS